MNSYKISKLLIAHLYTTFLLSPVERAVGYSLVKNTKQACRREKCTVNKSYELINSKPIISLFLGGSQFMSSAFFVPFVSAEDYRTTL